MGGSKRVLTSGYCALDVIYFRSSITHAAGGTAANVAANLQYLGCDASFVGRLGQDAVGRRIVTDLRNHGVGVDLIERDPGIETPVVLHRVEPPRHAFSFSCPDCERRFPKHRPISQEHLQGAVMPRVGGDLRPHVFFFDRASAASLVLASALREAGSVIIFEPSSRGDAGRTMEAARIAHVVKVSAERVAGLHPGLLEPRDGQWQIETASADGLRFRRGRSAWRTVAGFRIADVDSAGAGDWLTASFVNSWNCEDFLEAAPDDIAGMLREAQRLAALSCGYVGARTLASVPLADVRELEERLTAGETVRLRSVRRSARSRALGVCPVCLGPYGSATAS